MKQICKTETDSTFYFEHTEDKVILWITNYYCCSDEKVFDTEVSFCGICGYRPERSKREDSQKCEMRCSEHCGNTVRDK